MDRKHGKNGFGKMTGLNIHDLKHKELTEQIIQAFYKIYNTLSHGFLEKIYINALLMELNRMGLRALREAPIHVYYDGTIVGDYFSDIIVEDLIIIEVKAAKHFS